MLPASSSAPLCGGQAPLPDRLAAMPSGRTARSCCAWVPASGGPFLVEAQSWLGCWPHLAPHTSGKGMGFFFSKRGACGHFLEGGCMGLPLVGHMAHPPIQHSGMDGKRPLGLSHSPVWWPLLPLCLMAQLVTKPHAAAHIVFPNLWSNYSCTAQTSRRGKGGQQQGAYPRTTTPTTSCPHTVHNQFMLHVLVWGCSHVCDLRAWTSEGKPKK